MHYKKLMILLISILVFLFTLPTIVRDIDIQPKVRDIIILLAWENIIYEGFILLRKYNK